MHAELLHQYPVVAKPSLQWCCEAHKVEAKITEKEESNVELELAVSQVRNAVERALVGRNGVLSRNILNCIVYSEMQRHGVLLPPDMVNNILNKSVASWKDICTAKEWGRSSEKVALFDGIPYPNYSIEKFIVELSTKLVDPVLHRKYLVRAPAPIRFVSEIEHNS